MKLPFGKAILKRKFNAEYMEYDKIYKTLQ